MVRPILGSVVRRAGPSTSASLTPRGYYVPSSLLRQRPEGRTLPQQLRERSSAALAWEPAQRTARATSRGHGLRSAPFAPPQTMNRLWTLSRNATPRDTAAAIEGRSGFDHSQLRKAFSTSASNRAQAAQAENAKGQEQQSAEDPDQPPPKASLKERLRFLSRRYGWWAILVYLLASAVDFGLVFLAIHLLGAEHIRELETAARDWVGLGKRDAKEESDTGKNLKEILGVDVGDAEPAAENNFEARRAVAEKLHGQGSGVAGEADGTRRAPSGSSGTLWAEAVLAYTIHKTLLLPFRVAFTAAVLPSFVKLMVRWGLSKPNHAVRAASAAKNAASSSSAAAR